MDISKIDKNFEIKKVESDGGEFYDIRQEPFRIYGLYHAKEEPQFKRLPDSVAKSVSPGVAGLYLDTAGGRVRFSTDSPYIVIDAELSGVRDMAHMPYSGCAGFDLFFDDAQSGLSRYVNSFIPPFRPQGSFRSKVNLGEAKMRSFTINFPSYCGVKNLFVGVKEGSVIGEGVPYREEKPIVYYGSSITQGACASRPGNSYQNIIARRLRLDYINLGFSGNGKAEDAIIDYMASLNMSAFVSDYDHNSPSASHLETTHKRLYEGIRRAHPDIPYIMISRPDFDVGYNDSIERRRVIFDTYSYARSLGDKNVYFIDGESIFRGEYRDMCTVDNCHPND